MAPLTRARCRRDSIPLVPTLADPNSPLRLASTSTPRQNRVRGQDQDNTQPPASPPSTPNNTDSLPNVQAKAPEDTDTNTDTGVDNGPASDDEAPEAFSLQTGREAASKLEQGAKRANEAQEKAARQKRKDRDVRLKEQKSEAAERKRRRVVVDKEGGMEQQEEGGIDESRVLTVLAAPAEKERENGEGDGFEVAKRPTVPLLPESLLAQVSALRKRQSEDSESEEEGEAEGKKIIVRSSASERNRRKKQRKKLNRGLKKGPVNVQVLRDDAASRRVLPPPAAKIVGSIKDAWLFRKRKGGVERRSVGGGFVRGR